MKKSLLALVAALACAGAAQAQSTVQISGLVDVYAGSMRQSGSAGRTSTVGSGGMTTSWLGFSGKEDLGNGLKAEFVLSSFLRADVGNLGRYDGDPAFSRDANVALSGGFGTLRLGRSKAPNFLPTILANPYGDSFTVSPLVLHANMASLPAWGFGNLTTPADTGWSNQVTYSTPSIGGLSANLHYQFGEQGGDTGKGNVGVNLMYFGGPLTLLGFYEHVKISNPVNPAPINTKTDWMLGGAYDFSVVKAYATYGQAEVDATNFEARTISLGLDLPVMSKAGTVKAAVARTKVEGPANATRTTASLGYDHFLSKRTDLYAVTMHDKITHLKSGTSLVLGVRHRF
ncbi:porin [Pantoea sp. 18069]|uniref:porin n=1 Tax=Pantoea sp. 18069 TaxID=2681415 RepID=UPI001357F965|nr:porin [Pantoea sp. 18069]